MYCPNCGNEQWCPCDSCREMHQREIVWEWVTPDGPIACGHCGHTMSVDEWDDEGKRQKEGVEF